MSSNKKSLGQLCNEMYDPVEENRTYANRDVNRQILNLLKSQGISDEEIENFVNFINNQASRGESDYESSERFGHRLSRINK